MSDELKPCPFCGEAEMVFIDHEETFNGWQPRCGGCDVALGHYKSEKSARNVWNRRASAVSEPVLWVADCITDPEQPAEVTGFTQCPASGGYVPLYTHPPVTPVSEPPRELSEERVAENLAAMLRRMIWHINKMPGDIGLKVVAGHAKGLLHKYGLEGNLLREAGTALNQPSPLHGASAGDVYSPKECHADMWCAGIHIEGHGNAIECYGGTREIAEARRDAVLQAMRAAHAKERT